MKTPLFLALLVACTGPDRVDGTPDGPDPTDTGTTETTSTDLPVVGTDVLRFKGEVPKNLLFLSIDTFRKDHVGVHGDKDLTPFMDALAESGVVLNDHTQCSNWTYGSTTCTLAGRYNIERGQWPRLNGSMDQKPQVVPGTPFLATWLAEADFYNIVVTGNSWMSETWGNTQGYHEEHKPGGAALKVHETGSGALLDAMARGDVDDRWFLHLHFMEPHASYNPPDEYLDGIDELEPWPEDLTERPTHYEWRNAWPNLDPADQDLLESHLRVMYEGEVKLLDDRFATFWATMQAQGLLEDTLVVLWNDHGEQFWEHGKQTHAYALYGEENDGFAIFWADNIIPGTWDGPTASIDLVPTLLDLYDLPMPPEVTGIPVGEAPDDRLRFGEALAREGATQSVVRDGKKLMFWWSTSRVEFYDRNTDPGEQVDLYDPTDPEVLELWAELKPMIEMAEPLVLGGFPTVQWPDELP